MAFSISFLHFYYNSFTQLNITEKYIALNSIVSSDNKKALVCHINNKGRTGCHIFNEQTNSFGNETIFFYNCKIDNTNTNQNGIDITYVENKKEYILLCASFISIKNCITFLLEREVYYIIELIVLVKELIYIIHKNSFDFFHRFCNITKIY